MKNSSMGAAPVMMQRRFLNLHEYQSMEIFNKFGVGVPKFKVCKDKAEFGSMISFMLTSVFVILILEVASAGIDPVEFSNFYSYRHLRLYGD